MKDSTGPDGAITSGGKTVEEVAISTWHGLDKRIVLPNGATAVRVKTQWNGRKHTNISPIGNLKAANPFHDAGVMVKMEAGTFGKGGNFHPINQPVRLRMPPDENEHGSETEKYPRHGRTSPKKTAGKRR